MALSIRRARFASTLVLSTGLAGLLGCQTRAPEAGAQPVSIARGKDIYQRHCSGCHAAQGTGDWFSGVPALAGQRLEYLRRQIERFSHDERHNARMRWAFERVSLQNPQAAIDVATYLSQLPVQRFAGSDLRNRAQGEARFAALCAPCHGADARGSADGTVPALRAQHDSYLVSRLRELAAVQPPASVGAHALDGDSAIAISAYLSSLQGSDVGSR